MAKIWDSVMQFMRRAMVGRMPAAITCGEFENFIVSYLDGTLEIGIRAKFEDHIRDCPACRQYLAAYERTVEVGKKVYEDAGAQISGDVPEDLVMAVLRARFGD